MESPEQACCVVTVSSSSSEQKPLSCSGVILNPRAGIVLCNALPFSRFMRDKESLSDQRFLLPNSFHDNLKIRLKLSEQRDLDTNLCAYDEAERVSPHQHQAEAVSPHQHQAEAVSPHQHQAEAVSPHQHQAEAVSPHQHQAEAVAESVSPHQHQAEAVSPHQHQAEAVSPHQHQAEAVSPHQHQAEAVSPHQHQAEAVSPHQHQAEAVAERVSPHQHQAKAVAESVSPHQHQAEAVAESVSPHQHQAEAVAERVSPHQHQAEAVAESVSPHQHQAEAQLLMLVNCVEFRRAFLRIFKKAEKWGFYGGEEDAEMIRDSEFLSWFAVLKAPALKSGPVDPGTTTLPWVSSTSLRKGCTVLACGSPFGSLCPDLFMGTLSKGIVSNLAGEENAVVLTDARCLPGTEGGGLFVPDGHRARLAGVIVSPLCWKGSEWIGLTLACSLQLILRNIVWCMKILDPLRDDDDVRFQNGSADSSQPGPESERHISAVHRYPTVALVDSGQFWGSGVLVGPRLVLTCRHVVSGKSVVTLKFNSKEDRFRDVVGDVLYATEGSSPYDVAVVHLRDSALEEVVPRLSSSYQPGEDVVVVGYGALGRSCGPSLTCGILSRAVSWRSHAVMLQTTCAVQAGASGGAVVRAHTGELLGLVSSNTKDFAANVTYPHLNFSIPVTVLQPLLRRYEQTGDAGVFGALDMAEEGVRRVWRLQAAQSKL